jgi:hypothetical protein
LCILRIVLTAEISYCSYINCGYFKSIFAARAMTYSAFSKSKRQLIFQHKGFT